MDWHGSNRAQGIDTRRKRGLRSACPPSGPPTVTHISNLQPRGTRLHSIVVKFLGLHAAPTRKTPHSDTFSHTQSHSATFVSDSCHSTPSRHRAAPGHASPCSQSTSWHRRQASRRRLPDAAVRPWCRCRCPSGTRPRCRQSRCNSCNTTDRPTQGHTGVTLQHPR